MCVYMPLRQRVHIVCAYDSRCVKDTGTKHPEHRKEYYTIIDMKFNAKRRKSTNAAVLTSLLIFFLLYDRFIFIHLFYFIICASFFYYHPCVS